MIISDKKKYAVNIDEEEISSSGLSLNGKLEVCVNERRAPLYKAKIVDDGRGTLFLVLFACSNADKLSDGIEISIPSGECEKISHLFKQVICEIPLEKEEKTYEKLS